MPSPPKPMPTLRGAANAAANCATLGMLYALAGRRPEVVAVRAVRAMAVAISTSRSYAAFIAAAAAAESIASICAKDPSGCGTWPPRLVARHVRNDYQDALDAVMGPDAAGDALPLLFNDDDDFHLSRTRPRNPFPIDGIRPFESSPAHQNAVLDMTTNLVMLSMRQQPI